MNLSKTRRLQPVCAVLLLCVAIAIASPAQTLTTLVNLDRTTGTSPSQALVQGPDGNFYGTLFYGGNNGQGQGTVYKITPKGAFTTLHLFTGSDGKYPSGLVLGKDGNLYGTTVSSGLSSLGGTIYRISPSGAFKTLYTFCSQRGCSDGASPNGPLVQATDGSFYGTTASGGNSCACGTMFRITPGGVFTSLYAFTQSTGLGPRALIQGTDGNLYGTTVFGGANDDGEVFEISLSGILTVLHSFDGSDGASPTGALVQASDGNFYGMTRGYNITATVFQITSQGVLTTLHSFASIDAGITPYGELIQATDGNLYGVTYQGGDTQGSCNSVGCGTVFDLGLDGNFTTLHKFSSTDGKSPTTTLLQATNGTFYGTANSGGASSLGTIFSLSTGLGPFVKTVPATGKVGISVNILGGNLTGSTSVTFNGTPATFTVVSKTLIKATVPAGATTGKVQVITPNRPLTSNVPFRVID